MSRNRDDPPEGGELSRPESPPVTSILFLHSKNEKVAVEDNSSPRSIVHSQPTNRRLVPYDQSVSALETPSWTIDENDHYHENDVLSYDGDGVHHSAAVTQSGYSQDSQSYITTSLATEFDIITVDDRQETDRGAGRGFGGPRKFHYDHNADIQEGDDETTDDILSVINITTYKEIPPANEATEALKQLTDRPPTPINYSDDDAEGTRDIVSIDKVDPITAAGGRRANVSNAIHNAYYYHHPTTYDSEDEDESTAVSAAVEDSLRHRDEFVKEDDSVVSGPSSTSSSSSSSSNGYTSFYSQYDSKVHNMADFLRGIINKGAPLYNKGKKKACYEIYVVAAMQLADSQNNNSKSPEMDGANASSYRKMLTKARKDAAESVVETGKYAEGAWILRYCFDTILDKSKETQERFAV